MSAAGSHRNRLIWCVETIADNVSGLVSDLKLNESSLNADKLKNLLRQLPKMQEVTEKVLNSDLAGSELPKTIDAAQQVLSSGMLDKQVLETLGRIGRMSADSYPVGIGSLGITK